MSVLDRLIDQDPRTTSEPEPARAKSVSELKRAVRRDLEWLLNTRRVANEPDDSLPELKRSVYNFGLPDFSAVSLANPKDRGKLIRALQNTIKMFEPRLANIRITAKDSEGRGHRLAFRVDGLLLLDPAPEHVSFDTFLELTSRKYEVKGDIDAG